jgi:hypothetical protein
MGFFGKLFGRNRPSERLRETSRHLAPPSDPNVMFQEMMAGLKSGAVSDRSQAKEDLFDLCEGTQPYVKSCNATVQHETP